MSFQVIGSCGNLVPRSLAQRSKVAARSTGITDSGENLFFLRDAFSSFIVENGLN